MSNLSFVAREQNYINGRGLVPTICWV